MQENALRTLIRSRAILKNQRERQQCQLLKDFELHHATIQSKLTGLAETTQFENFCRCGREMIFRSCNDCGAFEEFPYRCSIKWCPRCQWIITERRRQILEKWTSRILQPKHLVLTQKNFQTLTRGKLREHQKNLAKIRRCKCWKLVKGGSVSIEITNEERGWHLHSHWLLDVRWLDMPEISQVWGKLCGQEFAIVKIMDCRKRDYLQEVSKYVAEGSEIAKWPREEILEFVTAIRGRRFFFAFGSLFHEGKAIRAEILQEKKPAAVCQCGACNWKFETETQALLAEVKKLQRQRPSRHDAKRAASSPRPDCNGHKEHEDCQAQIEFGKHADGPRKRVDDVVRHRT